MRDDAIRLYDWYPLFPGTGTVPAFVGNIRDMRIYVKLPAGDIDYTQGTDALRLYLTGISTTTGTATVICYCPYIQAMGVAATYNISVYKCSDAEYPASWPPAPGSSYILVNDTVNESCCYQINNDCVTVWQEAPEITVKDRCHITHEDVETSSPAVVTFATAAIESGNNLTVLASDGSIAINGAISAGLGKWTTSPFTDISSLTGTDAVGARSINGRRGDMYIDGDAYISVDVSSDVSSTTEYMLTLRPATVDESDI